MKTLFRVGIFITFLCLLLANPALAEPQMEIEFERELLVERGWLKYIDIIVNNVGDSDLNNVIVDLENENYDWFSDIEKNVNIIPGDSKKFKAKLDIGPGVSVGSYEFSLIIKSDQLIEIETINVQIFSSEKEMLEYQIGSLEERFKKLEADVKEAELEGKLVDNITVTLSWMSSVLEEANRLVLNDMFGMANEKIKNVDYLLKETEYDLSIVESRKSPLEPGEVDWSLYLIGLVIIIIIFISLRNKKLKGRDIGSMFKLSGVKFKRLMLNSGTEKIENEINGLRDNQRLLDEELKNKTISKSSYDELSILNKERILELGQKLKK